MTAKTRSRILEAVYDTAADLGLSIFCFLTLQY